MNGVHRALRRGRCTAAAAGRPAGRGRPDARPARRPSPDRRPGSRTPTATGRCPRSTAPPWTPSPTPSGPSTGDINAADENPLIDVAGQAVWHNGNFHTAYLGLALDAVRAALFQTAALAAARLGTLVEPRFTGLTPFLAGEPQPSSGIMILEYVAHAAVADIRRLAAPAALGAAVLSRGVEDHAGFSTQSARATTDVLTPYRMVLASELVAAVRALRMAQLRPAGAELADALALAAGALSADTRTGRWTTTWPPPWTCSPAWPA